MQREEPDGIILLCDFCRRDWDGQEPMIEGHHGSILCLECMKIALRDQKPAPAKYKCTLCLRFNIAPELPQWNHPGHVDSIVCQECLYQAARAFSRNPDIDWKFVPADHPPTVKPPTPAPEPTPP